jgi:hypothetical protein
MAGQPVDSACCLLGLAGRDPPSGHTRMPRYPKASERRQEISVVGTP